MKKSTLFAVVMAVLCLNGCNNKKNVSHEYNDSAFEKLIHERNIERRQEEYNVLCNIGMSNWDSFEKYYDFVEVDSNEKNLDKELEQYGISLWELGFVYNSSFTEFDINTQVNDLYIKWLYLNLRASNVIDYTFNDFTNSFWNEKDLMFIYEKSHEIGLVDNFENFLSLIFESDCDYCKEKNWDEWKEELEEEY